MKKRIMISLCLCLCIICVGPVQVAHASTYDEFFWVYREGVKLYKESDIVEGKQLLTKYIDKRYHDNPRYQILSISKNEIILRPQKGKQFVNEPTFQDGTFKCKISKKCKFYIRNIAYPIEEQDDWSNQHKRRYYRKISKKQVKFLIKKTDIIHEAIPELDIDVCYYGGYFGNIYFKNGQVVAILTDFGL